MKLITREILPFQENDIFSPMRDKIDYARVVLYSSRILLFNSEIKVKNSNSSLKLIIDKMSRVFLYNGERYFSISFPFNVINDGNEIISIETYSGVEVDSKIISYAISIISNDQFKLKPSPVDFLFEVSSAEESGLRFLEEIFLTEPAYIRYDVDPVNFNGKLHPLVHLDINYSSYGTYKVGLEKKIIDTQFENMLNISTDCSFLSE